MESRLPHAKGQFLGERTFAQRHCVEEDQENELFKDDDDIEEPDDSVDDSNV